MSNVQHIEMNSKCALCMTYIYDTLQRPLAQTHPHKAFIRIARISPGFLMELTKTMNTLLRKYIGHKNLVLRILRETRTLAKDDNYSLVILDKILSWYKYLFMDMKQKKQEKHVFLQEIEYMGYEMIARGYIQTRQKEDPLEVFKKWYMTHYLHFLEELDVIHDEHENKPKHTIIVDENDLEYLEL